MLERRGGGEKDERGKGKSSHISDEKKERGQTGSDGNLETAPFSSGVPRCRGHGKRTQHPEGPRRPLKGAKPEKRGGKEDSELTAGAAFRAPGT